MTNPLIDILIPVFNEGDQILKTIDLIIVLKKLITKYIFVMTLMKIPVKAIERSEYKNKVNLIKNNHKVLVKRSRQIYQN